MALYTDDITIAKSDGWVEIVRDNEHIINAGTALNLTSEQLDQMFIDGAKL